MTTATKPKLDLQALFPEYGEEHWEGALLFDGYEEAFVGFATQFTKDPVAVYDRAKCIACLERQGMSNEEAEEYFEFNTAGAWVGERTPMILQAPTRPRKARR
jgi:hypothetical protein